MTNDTFKAILTAENLARIFPKERADEFFEALFGDASEGSYDIELAYREVSGNTLIMDLPQVFSRHPIINVNGIVGEIDTLLGDGWSCRGWSLGYTEQYNRSLHVIPIKIDIEKK
jgi:hypothetical protein